jgi:hypothetical protein
MTMINSPRRTPEAGRDAGHSGGQARSILCGLAVLAGLACALPAAAQFSSREGYTDGGSPTVTVEAMPYIYLPHSDLTIGLDRPAGEDVNVDRPRPTVAQALSKLSFAFTCDCIMHYGNWTGEVNIIYISLKNQTIVPPLPPSLPQATLNIKASAFYISPGIGYRVFSSNTVSFAARAGFTYASLSADSDFQLGEFATSGSRTRSLIQPWIGERFDYYPSPRWRIENTFALTGLGVDGGSIGWNGKLAVSYLITRWLDVTAGYMANQLKKNASILPDGTNRSVNILLYGPVVGFGFRF